MQSLSNITSHTAFSNSYRHHPTPTVAFLTHCYLFKLLVLMITIHLQQHRLVQYISRRFCSSIVKQAHFAHPEDLVSSAASLPVWPLLRRLLPCQAPCPQDRLSRLQLLTTTVPSTTTTMVTLSRFAPPLLSVQALMSLDNYYLSRSHPPSSPCLLSVAGSQSLSSTSTATSRIHEHSLVSESKKRVTNTMCSLCHYNLLHC
jgi:hypothetical protein